MQSTLRSLSNGIYRCSPLQDSKVKEKAFAYIKAAGLEYRYELKKWGNSSPQRDFLGGDIADWRQQILGIFPGGNGSLVWTIFIA